MDNIKLDEAREDLVAVTRSLESARRHLESLEAAEQKDAEAIKAAKQAVEQIAERAAQKKASLTKSVNIMANRPKSLTDEDFESLRLAAEVCGKTAVYSRALRHSTPERWAEWRAKKKARRSRQRRNRRVRRLLKIQNEISENTAKRQERLKEKEAKKLLRSTPLSPPKKGKRAAARATRHGA